jgi:hypothetical protein
MNFGLTYNKKKVYLTEDTVPWEHEQFSKKKILAGTLAGKESASFDIFNRTLFSDITIDKQILKRNIKFLSESLLAFLFDYDIRNFTIFKDDEALLDELSIETAINYFSKIPRSPLNIAKNSGFNNYIFNILTNYLTKTQKQSFEYNEMKFYDTNSGNIKVYSTKSKLIDLYLLIVVIVYLFIVYVYTKVIFILILGVYQFPSWVEIWL